MDEKQKDRMATIIAGLAATGFYTHHKLPQKPKIVDGEKVWEDELFLGWSLWDDKSTDGQYDLIKHAVNILQELEKTEL